MEGRNAETQEVQILDDELVGVVLLEVIRTSVAERTLLCAGAIAQDSCSLLVMH